ncbi:MAG: hypothetical protein N4A33_04535 [Bacteriovoracaceae bacterium]|jgi:hypothetical protein|nr:hypothetical protein [Bacteriovoracaceae bacterium]
MRLFFLYFIITCSFASEKVSDIDNIPFNFSFESNSRSLRIKIIKENSYISRDKDGAKSIKLYLKIMDKKFNHFEVHYNKIKYVSEVSNKYGYTSLIFDPFKSDYFYVLNKKGKYKVKVHTALLEGQSYLRDHTCNKATIILDNPQKVPLILNCKYELTGKFLNQKKKLILTFKALNNEKKVVRIRNKRSTTIHFDKSTISIYTKYNNKDHKMGLALGLGPYQFDTKFNNEKKNNGISSALMVYTNFKINHSTSIRGFDAAVWNDSTFNNAGIYLANDFSYAFDKQLVMTTLLGVQYLHFKFNSNSTSYNEPIYPQGIEFTYRNFLDIPHYILSGGIFLSTQNDLEYKNAWIRWGKGYYWELNLITWAKNEFSATTYGLSVIFPLAKLF